ncbi:MAG: hypothetical protein NT178_09380 [Proteobacteria bacterium]|nr:hypothetical protein [Pseudomonadota bacterium]
MQYLEKNPKLRKAFYDSKNKGKITSKISLKQSSHGMWTEAVVGIVNELKRIDYTERKAFIRTGAILNIFYPNVYTDPDPDLVRQKYKTSKQI